MGTPALIGRVQWAPQHQWEECIRDPNAHGKGTVGTSTLMGGAQWGPQHSWEGCSRDPNAHGRGAAGPFHNSIHLALTWSLWVFCLSSESQRQRCVASILFIALEVWTQARVPGL